MTGNISASMSSSRAQSMHEQIIPFEELIRGDPRNRTWSWFTTDALQEELVAIRLSPAAPEVVAHEVMLAKRIALSGWFFYDLFAAAIHHAAVACESALRERFVAELPLPIQLELPPRTNPRTRALANRPDAQDLFENLRDRWRLVGRPAFRGTFGELVQWARDNTILDDDQLVRVDAVRQWRNGSAHGTVAVVPPNIPLTILRECVWIINSLFPDQETLEYDAPRIRELRDAQRRDLEERDELVRALEMADETTVTVQWCESDGSD